MLEHVARRVVAVFETEQFPNSFVAQHKNRLSIDLIQPSLLGFCSIQVVRAATGDLVVLLAVALDALIRMGRPEQFTILGRR